MQKILLNKSPNFVCFLGASPRIYIAELSDRFHLQSPLQGNR